MKKYHPEEFIGMKMDILNAKNKDLLGIKGIILDETKNTFKIKKYDNKIKIIQKQGNLFKINNLQINGDDIVKKPEERIKNK